MPTESATVKRLLPDSRRMEISSGLICGAALATQWEETVLLYVSVYVRKINQHIFRGVDTIWICISNTPSVSKYKMF
jgi:hypothetical protein